MNINAKVHKKYVQTEFIKKSMYHDQIGFFPEMQGWFNIHKSIRIMIHE